MTNDIKNFGLFFNSLFHNNLFLGFIGFIFITVIVVAFILAKNPKHIPLILRFSKTDSFQRIAHRDKNGTYLTSYSKFLKMHVYIRTLFYTASIIFIAIIMSIVVIIYK